MSALDSGSDGSGAQLPASPVTSADRRSSGRRNSENVNLLRCCIKLLSMRLIENHRNSENRFLRLYCSPLYRSTVASTLAHAVYNLALYVSYWCGWAS